MKLFGHFLLLLLLLLLLPELELGFVHFYKSAFLNGMLQCVPLLKKQFNLVVGKYLERSCQKDSNTY